jgi:hypothetical protein
VKDRDVCVSNLLISPLRTSNRGEGPAQTEIKSLILIAISVYVSASRDAVNDRNGLRPLHHFLDIGGGIVELGPASQAYLFSMSASSAEIILVAGGLKGETTSAKLNRNPG